jgi:hypothetical protein
LFQRNEGSDYEEESDAESGLLATTSLTLRIPLGSCNGVSPIKQVPLLLTSHKIGFSIKFKSKPLIHFQQQHGAHKRHQSLSPVPTSQKNSSRPGSPPHTPPKLSHHSPVKNGHVSLYEESVSAKSPPTPHKIRLLEEKENAAKPKRK